MKAGRQTSGGAREVLARGCFSKCPLHEVATLSMTRILSPTPSESETTQPRNPGPSGGPIPDFLNDEAARIPIGRPLLTQPPS